MPMSIRTDLRRVPGYDDTGARRDERNLAAGIEVLATRDHLPGYPDGDESYVYCDIGEGLWFAVERIDVTARAEGE